jgi:hypothetical protein
LRNNCNFKARSRNVKIKTMSRTEALINKLKEQFEQGADSSHLLLTVQMLQAELTQSQMKGNQVLGTSKVSVVLPRIANLPLQVIQSEKHISKTEEKPAVQEVKEKVLLQDDSVSLVGKNGQLDMVFDPMQEIPTLAHQLKEKAKEAPGTSASALQGEETLNDRLKQGKTELMEILRETPVKDLRKAIGINDRFLFVNDLFRGDETMYERSIKTINSFTIYPEAEYWMNRELKVKLGWDDNKETVKQFYLLVKRRFS